MITKMENGITHCKMGEGTLYSGVIKDTGGAPRGIVFSNQPNDTAGGVLFEINDMKGFAGLLLPVVSLMEEWHVFGATSGTEEEKAQFLEQIKTLKETLEPLRPVSKKS